MDRFLKNKWTQWTIIVLVLLNLSMLSIFWIQYFNNSKPGQRHPQAKKQSLEFLKNELGLTTEQFDEYKKLQRAHQQQAQKIQIEIQGLRKQMMEQLFVEDPNAQWYVEQIAMQHQTLDQLTFSHFQDLQKLLGIEQEQKLRKLLSEFYRQNRPEHPPQNGEGPPPHHQPPHPNRDRHRPPQD